MIDPGEVTRPQRRSRLSVVQGGAGRSRWSPTTLDRLTRALDLRQAGALEFEAAAAETEWPAFPGALLVASAVVAAERSFPGYSMEHLCCAFGQLPRADQPVEVVLGKIHAGASSVTGRVAFYQDGAAHGEVAVLLRSGAGTVLDDIARQPARAALPPPPAAARGGEGRPPVAIVPWELLSVPGPAATLGADRTVAPAGAWPARCSPVCSRTWSRALGATADGTLQRALLAYLSEPLPIASGAGVPYPGQAEAGLSATVLSHAITYGASFDVRDWLLATVEAPAVGAGYMHALATVRTRHGSVAAAVSQAAAVWDGGAGPTCRRSSGMVLSEPPWEEH